MVVAAVAVTGADAALFLIACANHWISLVILNCNEMPAEASRVLRSKCPSVANAEKERETSCVCLFICPPRENVSCFLLRRS